MSPTRLRAGAIALALSSVISVLGLTTSGVREQPVAVAATMNVAPPINYNPVNVAVAQAQLQSDISDYLEARHAHDVAVAQHPAVQPKKAIVVHTQSTAPEAVTDGPVDCMANHGPKWRMPSMAMAHQCWDGLLAQYGWSTTVAFQKLWCESGGNPWAANASGAHGLLQILSKDESGNYVGSFDPATNVRQGWEKYEAAGHSWSPWTC